MTVKIWKILIVLFVFLISINSDAQNSFLLSGFVKDINTGKNIPGV